jgi:hypothetical protein
LAEVVEAVDLDAGGCGGYNPPARLRVRVLTPMMEATFHRSAYSIRHPSFRHLANSSFTHGS